MLGVDPWRDGDAAAPAHRRDAPGGRPLSGRAPARGAAAVRLVLRRPRRPRAAAAAWSGSTTRAHTLVRRMSGGQQQRLSLALALVGKPDAGVPRRADRGHGPARARDDVDDDPRAARPRRRPSCSPRTRWTRPSTCATASASSTTVAWSRATRPRSSRRAPRPTRPRSRPSPASRSTSSARRLGLDPGRVRELRPGDYLVDTAATPALLAALTAWLRRAGRPAERAAGRAPPSRGRVPPPHRRGPLVKARRRDPGADPHRGAAHVAARREPAGDAGDPARHPRVLLVGRRGEHDATRTRSTSWCPACSRWR